MTPPFFPQSVAPVAGTMPDLGNLQSGKFYVVPNETSDSTSALAATGTAYCYFWPLSKLYRWSAVGLEVVTPQAASSARLFAYTDLNGLPASLIFDSGSLATTAAGAITFSITNLTLPPPGVWIGVEQDAGGAAISPRMRAAPLDSFMTPENAIGNANVQGYSFVNAGALPATAPAPATLAVTQQVMPKFYLQAA